jgi:hypothetical protein
MNEFNDIILEAIKLILAGIIGGLIGARANDRLTRNRERESGVANRKRDFLAFMAQLKAQAMVTHITEFGEFYANKIPNLRHSSELIAGDFHAGKRADFEVLVAAACDLTEKDIYNPNNKQEIMARVEEIIAFVKNPPRP